MTNDHFNRTLSFNTKLKYFIAAWLLIEVVLIDAVYKFILALNNRNIIHFGEDFDTYQLVWGDSIIFNLIRLVILCLFAVLFGITYSYLARKVRESDKAAISLANGFFAVFGTFILTIVLVWIIALFTHSSPPISEMFQELSNGLKSSTFISTMMIIQFISTSICSFIGLNIGQRLIADSVDEEKGRLLGIKWYHYLWLWYAIGIYAQSLLFLVYLTLHSIRIFLDEFNIGDIFGGKSGENQSNSLDTLGGALILYYFVAIIVVYLVRTQQEILSGKSEIHAAWKIIISIFVAFIIPVLLLMFTIVGDI